MDFQIEKVKKDAESFVVRGKDLTFSIDKLKIEKPEDLDIARMLLTTSQRTEKELEDTRVRVVKPLNDFIKEANSLFKEIGDPILKAKADIKEKIVAYNNKIEQERKAKEEADRKAEQERLDKIEAARKEREDAERKKQADEQKALDGGVLTESEIEDQRQQRIDDEQQAREDEEAAALEAKRKDEEDGFGLANIQVKGVTKRWTYKTVHEEAIPRKFCSPDSKKINEAIKAGVRTIEGLEIYEEASVK